MNNNLQDSKILKIGLGLSLIIQLIVALICLTFAAGSSSFSFIDSTTSTALWIVFGISFVAMLLTSASIYSVYKAKVLNKQLLTIAGIIAIFTTIIGGLLILAGTMSTTQPGDRRRDRHEDDDVLFGRPSRYEYRKRRLSRANRFPS